MSDEQGSSRRIVADSLAGRAVGRVATGPLAVHWCAKRLGISLRDYTLDPRCMAKCVVRYWEDFRPDAIWISADTWVTAGAMGAAVAFPGEGQPMCGTGRPLVSCATDISRIAAPHAEKQGRFPIMLEALERIKRGVGKDAFVVACFDQYPFSLACALMGIENAMTAASHDRRSLESLMDRCAEYAIEYAGALAERGVDMLSGGDSPAGLLGPRLYREVALPYEQCVIAALKSRTKLPVSLHICGNTMPILADMARSGADVLEPDHQVDLGEACRIVGPTAIWGNLDPVAVLARGTPDRVKSAARSAIAAIRAAGHRRFVLSSGCTLAMETPDENVRAMLKAARERD